MLLHRRPRQPVAHLRTFSRPHQPLRGKHRTRTISQQPLAPGEPPERVNVGVCGLQSDAIDWNRLEYGCREMLEREGTHYFQEQALTAMLLTGQECRRLGPPDYVVLPSLTEGRNLAAALHHYVSSSKRSYFQHGLRRALADAPGARQA